MSNIRLTRHRVFDSKKNDKIGLAYLNLWRVAVAAAEETLQGGPLAPAWLKLFRTQLSIRDQTWLRWQGDLAESAEVRRAYSGLYGRFVARSLLSHHLGLTRFIPLRRNTTLINGSVVVNRIKSGDIPDWLAWDDRQWRFVLCEAKGSLSSGDFLSAGGPKCVHDGKSQFARVEIRDGNQILLPDKWVAATRWSTDYRGGEPVTVLWDPPGDARPFSAEDAERHRTAMSRAWLDSIAPGMGWRNSDDILSKERAAAAVVIRAKPGAVPSDEDWLLLDEDENQDFTPISAEKSASSLRSPSVEADGQQDQKLINRMVELTLSDTLLDSLIYNDRSVLSRPAVEKVPHEGSYIAAVITRFGVRPVRSLAEFETLKREQDIASRLEEPAMVIGIPLKFDPKASLDGDAWIDGAGIATKSSLSLFDLRRVTVEPLDAQGLR